MPEYLQTTLDKFTFKVAADRSYCSDGIWLQDLGDSRVRVADGTGAEGSTTS